MKYEICRVYLFEDAERIRNAIITITSKKLNPRVMSFEDDIAIFINVKGRMSKEKLNYWRGFAEGVKYTG